MRYLTKTNTGLISICILLLRCMAGSILFTGGASKVFGWFGGFGITKTLEFYAMSGFSSFWAYLSMFTELIGGLLLILGLFTRFAAIPIMINMLVATIVTMPKGFLIGMGAYPMSILIDAIIIFIAGPMKYSFDALLLQSDEVIGKQDNQSKVDLNQKNNQTQKVMP